MLIMSDEIIPGFADGFVCGYIGIASLAVGALDGAYWFDYYNIA